MIKRSRGHGIESQRSILDGEFFAFVLKICFKRRKISDKEVGDGPF